MGKLCGCLDLTGSGGPVRKFLDWTEKKNLSVEFVHGAVPFVLILLFNSRLDFILCPQLITLLWKKLILDCIS